MTPDFEEFENKGRGTSGPEPSVTVRDTGGVFINAAGRQTLGDPNYIQYHVDTSQCLVAIEGVPEEDGQPPGTYSFKNDYASGTSVLREVGKQPPQETRTFVLEQDGDLLYFDASPLPDTDARNNHHNRPETAADGGDEQ